jgi:DNA-binding MarR family transcriptional regulator
LVAENYVKRTEHKTDTRAKSVNLTAKGKTMASKLVPMIEKIDEEFFGMMSKTNQQLLVKILTDLVSKIEGFD